MQISAKNQFSVTDTPGSIFAALLRERGLETSEEVDAYLHPQIPSLQELLNELGLNENLLNKMKKIVLDAIKNGEDICVFGDYDADGVTSTTIMWQTLMSLSRGSKARIMPFIPDRARHGYGLSDKAVQDIMEGDAFKTTAYPDFHPTLIVTVDNGIVARQSVQKLIDLGVKVIITDHHQPEDTLPPATAIVHSVVTSGAGISWVCALYLSDSNPAVVQMVDIATIGIVADQMPLIGVNRQIVAAGLQALNRTQNLGLKKLLEIASVADKLVTVYEINYVIAPRINAVGRLDNPLLALRLLCSRDATQVGALSATIEQHNKDRQLLTDQAIADALSGEVNHNIIVAASPTYHEGIIGLVAGKLAEVHNRPALVISVGAESSKGSARSVGDIDITAIMREHREFLLGVGGHKLAGGFSIATSKISEFTEAVYTYADAHIDASMLEKRLVVDGELQLTQITLGLARDIASMEPFGMGNPKPRFVVEDLKVLEDRKIGRDGRHRKLVVEQGGVTRDVIWFNGSMPHPLSTISRMVCTVEINVWRDRQSLQLNAQYVESN